jgi:hypothetical protein
MLRRSFVNIFAVWLIIFIFADTGEPFAQEWAPLDKTAVIEQVETVTTDKYPDADVVVVDQQTWTKYRQDGTYGEWFEQYIRYSQKRANADFAPSPHHLTYRTTLRNLPLWRSFHKTGHHTKWISRKTAV